MVGTARVLRVAAGGRVLKTSYVVWANHQSALGPSRTTHCPDSGPELVTPPRLHQRAPDASLSFPLDPELPSAARTVVRSAKNPSSLDPNKVARSPRRDVRDG